MDELIQKSACEIVDLLRSGEISTDDTLNSLAARIDQVDPEINALPILCFDRAREKASAQDFTDTILAGLPVPIKDLSDVAGVRTTQGSKLHEHDIAETSNIMVERIERNGAVVYAKSNTPEFGTGGNTFNDVFGATRNPYDLTRSAGGSSGGAAAAIASGMAWVAQGSDLGGSLRTPASFCGVTSLRPSPGLVTTSPGMTPFDVYSQTGPMARNVADLALFADALAGPSELAGLSKPHTKDEFRTAAACERKPARVAFSEDLGITETSAEVRVVCQHAVELLQSAGIKVEAEHPDLSMMNPAFEVPRALDYAQSYGADLERNRETFKPEVVWNIEYGLGLDANTIRSARDAQGQVFANASAFMQDFDLLLCPASIIPAFPVDERYPGFSEGLAYSQYYRWLAICCASTTTTLPVITVPCGKTDKGLPIGLQVIGKPHGELNLFAYASYIEQLFEWDPLQRIL